MKLSKCSSCGAEILWTTTANGKKMSVNIERSYAGTFDLVEEDGGVVAHWVKPVERSGRLLYQSHFSTCPHAAQHRKPERDPIPDYPDMVEIDESDPFATDASR